MTGLLRAVLLEERTAMAVFSRDIVKWFMMGLQNEHRKVTGTVKSFTWGLTHNSGSYATGSTSPHLSLPYTEEFIVSLIALTLKTQDSAFYTEENNFLFHHVFLVLTVFSFSHWLEKLIQNLTRKLVGTLGCCVAESWPWLAEIMSHLLLNIGTFAWEIAAYCGEIQKCLSWFCSDDLTWRGPVPLAQSSWCSRVSDLTQLQVITDLLYLC